MHSIAQRQMQSFSRASVHYLGNYVHIIAQRQMQSFSRASVLYRGNSVYRIAQSNMTGWNWMFERLNSTIFK